MTTSANCSAPRSRSKAPGDSVGLPMILSKPGYSTSWIKVDLPEPETPVTQTKRPSGISIETFLRLLAVTPSSSRRGVLGATGKGRGASTFMRPPMYLPVKVVASRSSSGVPSKTIWPPRSPGPGPTSMTRSAAIMTCGSCSTTTKVLPASRKRCITSTTR